MEKSFEELKKELIGLMVHVHGTTYTFGWLKSAYVNGCNGEMEQAIVRNEINNLKARMAT